MGDALDVIVLGQFLAAPPWRLRGSLRSRLDLTVELGGQGAGLLDAVGQGVMRFVSRRAQVGQALFGAGGRGVQIGDRLGEALVSLRAGP